MAVPTIRPSSNTPSEAEGSARSIPLQRRGSVCPEMPAAKGLIARFPALGIHVSHFVKSSCAQSGLITAIFAASFPVKIKAATIIPPARPDDQQDRKKRLPNEGAPTLILRQSRPARQYCRRASATRPMSSPVSTSSAPASTSRISISTSARPIAPRTERR